MAIIKSILHVFKKSDNAFKIMHPETESAQITDWHQGIVNTLASTALGGLVNTLTSDSLLAMMIQKVLTATGVKYNMAQNGYICFGALFGNLIIQWGLYTENKYFTFPISFKKMCIMVAVHATPDTGINKISVIDSTLSRGRVNSDGNGSSYVIMIGV